MTLLSFLSGILEGIGITAIIPLFSFLSQGEVKTTDTISQLITGAFVFTHITFTFRYVFALIMGVFILKAIVLFLVGYLSASLAADYEKNIRLQIFKLTLGAHWPYFLREKVGQLDQVLTTDVTYTSTLLLLLSSAIILLVNFLIYGLLVLNISVSIGLCTLVVGGFIFFIFKPLFRRNKQASQQVGVMYKEVAHYAIEQVLGMKTIKTLGVENTVVSKVGVAFERIRRLNIRVTTLRTLTSALLQPISILFVMGLFAFFYKTSRFNFASFAVMVYGINKIFANLQLAQSQIHSIISMVPYLRNALAYRDKVQVEQEINVGSKPFVLTKELVFNQVDFSYAGRDIVLKQIDFAVRQGEMIGLIGPSGAGKTTIVDLLLRLFTPSNGRITIDGVPSTDIQLSDWRRHIGYVSQDVFLTNDTIANNIRFYDSTITDAEVRAAATAAQLDAFIAEQPQGFDTPVGERGLLLSGGQRQRVALARVLARHPAMLILDEATSALDNESERHVQQAIDALRGQVTIIIIAHHLTTVLKTDRLVVLDQGRVVEQGRPEDLLTNHESYFYRMSHLESGSIERAV